MNKKFLSLAVAAAMAAPMAAQAQDVTLYGQLHYSLDYADVSSAAVVDDEDWATGVTRASRFGIKGSEDLGNGMKVIFKIENQVDNGAIASRNTYAGLSSDWGTVLMGRHDTPYKISTGSLDVFGDTAADYNVVVGSYAGMGGAGVFDIRAPQTIAYISPNMNGLTVAAAWVSYADDEGAASDETEALSLAAMYSNGPFFASLAYEAYEDGDNLLTAGTQMTQTGANTDSDTWKLGLGYKANGFSVGFVYEDMDADAGAPNANADQENWYLSGSYSFGNNVVKAAYGSADNDDAGEDYDFWAIGMDHILSKRTKVYALYTALDNSANANAALNSGGNNGDDAQYGGANGADSDVFSVGIVTKF